MQDLLFIPQLLVVRTAWLFPGGAGPPPPPHPPAPAPPPLSHAAAWDNNSSALLAALSISTNGPLKPMALIATNSPSPLSRCPS